MSEPDPLLNPERPDSAARWTTREAPTTGLDPLTVHSSSLSAGSSVRTTQPGPAPLVVPFPMAGERIDSFDLEESIGVGGMGAVFRARDLKLDRLVALKILPPEQSHDPDVVQRFYQEGRAAARLDQENIARVYTIGHDGRYHFIAFEYIEGTTIRQRVIERGGPLPVGEAINYTLQIADALVHAAERGVVHRDIKPSNIIVTPQGRAKLVDMGLARRFERGVDDGLTQSGMTLGTFDYISPEQARDPRDVDVRSDLYSLGCTLFHMLTGRPPFPEGTVLQKLIQHQEEAPPSVLGLNPSVPPELASILAKMMAKDRDRRYQTPEQLARDLLTLAGALGLRSLSPEGLVWSAPPVSPPAWERHLVWAIPVFAFSLIVLALVWAGQDPGRPAGRSNTGAAPSVTAAGPETGSPRAGPAAGTPENGTASRLAAPAVESAVGGEPVSGEAPPLLPKVINVDSSEDLLAALAAAPPRSEVVLTDAGPYRIGEVSGSPASLGRLARADLTIRAAQGVRPVLQFGRGSGSGRAALLDFLGGRVTLDGLEFDAGGAGGAARSSPPIAIRVEDTELALRRCVFRHTGPAGASAEVRAVALRVVSSGAFGPDGDRPPAVVLDRCHLDAGQVGLLASGPVDLSLRDCTIAAEPAIWLDDRGRALTPADLSLRHVSLVAGPGPVFRFDGASPRVRCDDTVVGATGEGSGTLVATDRPDKLTWRGRSNLYAGVATFLLPTGDAPGGQVPVRAAAAWEEAAGETRESESRFVTGPVWEQADPAAALAQGAENPARGFRLAPRKDGPMSVGARPSGTPEMPDPIGSLALANVARAPGQPTFLPLGGVPTETRVRETPSASPGTVGSQVLSERPGTTSPREAATSSNSSPVGTGTTKPVPEEDEPDPGLSGMDEIPEMPVMPPARPDPSQGVAHDPSPAVVVRPEIDPVASALRAPETAVGNRAELNPDVPAARTEVKAVSGVLRTADQFLNALAEPNVRGRVLRVAADADWELPGTVVRATGAWRVQAEPGATRPKLRFLPAAAPGAERSAGSLAALFDLRSGSLHFDGFDFILPKSNAPRVGRWAAFAVATATDLSLSNCTVTLEGSEVGSAVVALPPGETDAAAKTARGSGAPAATVRMQNSLMRAGGDLVEVRGGRRLALDLDNVVVATAGSLAHAQGVAQGQAAETLGLTLRGVTTHNEGGLVHLESAPDRPELPVAELNVRDSILSTALGVPLLRVDGQDGLTALRDRIVWDGLRVGYHKITIYRRDQSAQVGSVPVLYDQASWFVAVGVREMNPTHGDMKFRRERDETLPAWSYLRDDAELSPDSPATSSGCVLAKVPSPPAAFSGS